MEHTKSYTLGLKHGKAHTAKLKTFNSPQDKSEYDAGYKAGRYTKPISVKGLNPAAKAMEVYKTVFTPSNDWLTSFNHKVASAVQLVNETEVSANVVHTDVHVRYQVKKSYNKV